MLNAAIAEYVNQPPLTRLGPDAGVWLEHGTFYAGIQLEHGRLILGYGPTAHQALTKAVAAHEG